MGLFSDCRHLIAFRRGGAGHTNFGWHFGLLPCTAPAIVCWPLHYGEVPGTPTVRPCNSERMCPSRRRSRSSIGEASKR